SNITPSSHTSPGHMDILKAQDLSVIIKAYVLVTSLTPLRAFIHSTTTVWHPPKKKHFSVKLQRFFEIFFKSSSPQQAFNNMKEAISKLLLITEVFSESSASGPNSFNQCSQCFQMLTFDIGFGTSIYPVVLEVRKLHRLLLDPKNLHQKEHIREPSLIGTCTNTLMLILPKSGELLWVKPVFKRQKEEQCLSLEEINSMITFIKELKNLGQFELLFPSAAPKIQTLLRDIYHMVDPMRRLGSVLTVHWLLSSLLEQFQFMTKEAHTNLSECEEIFPNIQPKPPLAQLENISSSPITYKDTLSHIRQIFTSPQLDLNPQFNPKIKEYYAEVPFDIVTVKIGAEPSNCQCQVHLDEKKGPSIANYPLGLGLNKVIILVTDDSQPSPLVVSSYKITIYREDRPSLPLFDDYMLCGFVQDCGSRIRPEESCGLQPLSHEYLSAISQTMFKTCEAGDTKGQWIVPCLSCSDNRTCDWREITWQPHGCQYSVLAKSELQRCVEGTMCHNGSRLPRYCWENYADIPIS
uniref:Cadherin-like beta-sandwich-like domain-containing protein n=1 Tax=Bubo bubo TaxID=30461 RepID=A0A8C0F1T9_BUBBB